jgi:hypothetical protein
MVDTHIRTGKLRRFLADNWRNTTALLISLCLHLAIYISYTPDYDKVKDVPVEFELVSGEGEQPRAPDAEGPRTPSMTPEDPEVPEETPVQEDPEVPEEQGVLVGDTDLSIDSEIAPADSDTRDSDTFETDSDSSSASDADTDSWVDSASGSDSDTADTSSDSVADTDSNTTTDSPTDLNDTETETTGLPSDTSFSPDNDTESEKDTQATDSDDSDSGTDSGGGGTRFPGSAGASTGEDGICLHDVFAFAKDNPTWMAWLSMKAFAGTRYEQGLANILGSFYLYNEMVAATEIDPMTELEGVLISADDFSSFDTYQVVATYNVGEDVLKQRLKKNMKGKTGFTLRQTAQGTSGIHRDSYRWDMVGAGRVLVASNARKGHLNPKWPANVTCMMPGAPFNGDAGTHFDKLVRSKLGPEKAGERWPVMVLATRDPGAAGMYYKPDLAKHFQYAILKGYFSDPIQIQGEVKFANPQVMSEVRTEIKGLLARAAYLKFLGLGSMVDNFSYEIKDDTFHFIVPVTEKQMVAILQILQQYSLRLNAHFTGKPPGVPNSKK